MTHEEISEKLVGYPSDGAAVMVGHLNGMAQKIKDDLAPRMVSTHCAAHRCNLVGEKLGSDATFVKVRLGFGVKGFPLFRFCLAKTISGRLSQEAWLSIVIGFLFVCSQ